MEATPEQQPQNDRFRIYQEAVLGEVLQDCWQNWHYNADISFDQGNDKNITIQGIPGGANSWPHLTPKQVRSMPSLITLSPTTRGLETAQEFSRAGHHYFHVILADPDIPSQRNHSKAPLIHWLSVNMRATPAAAPESGLAQLTLRPSTGEQLVKFVPSFPPMGTGNHRYTFLIFETENPIDVEKFPRQYMVKRGVLKRAKWNIRERFMQAASTPSMTIGMPVALAGYVSSFTFYALVNNLKALV